MSSDSTILRISSAPVSSTVETVHGRSPRRTRLQRAETSPYNIVGKHSRIQLRTSPNKLGSAIEGISKVGASFSTQWEQGN
jgi:hypothetical protein